LSTIRTRTAKELNRLRSHGNDVAIGQKACLGKVKGNAKKRDEAE
jgi:hypothetical protein